MVNLRGYFVVSLMILFVTSALADDYVDVSLAPNEYTTFTWSPDTEGWKIVVFTLKHQYANSDFDIAIVDKSGNLLSLGENSGTNTELLILSPEDGQSLDILVKNMGYTSASYVLYAKEVNLAEKAGEVFAQTVIQALIENLIKAAFNIDDDSESERNVGRASTVIMSILNEHNLAETSADFIINELTMRLREELGYGFWGTFAVNYAVSIVSDVYTYF